MADDSKKENNEIKINLLLAYQFRKDVTTLG